MNVPSVAQWCPHCNTAFKRPVYFQPLGKEWRWCEKGPHADPSENDGFQYIEVYEERLPSGGMRAFSAMIFRANGVGRGAFTPSVLAPPIRRSGGDANARTP